MLIDEIEEFIEKEIIPILPKHSMAMQKHYDSGGQLNFEFPDTPYMKASVKETEKNKYLIEISKGWMIRLGIIYALADSYWTISKGHRSIHIVTQESAYDSYIFKEHTPPEFLFQTSQPLKYLFLDSFPESILMDKIRDFTAVFNAAEDELDNLPRANGLKLPDTFSDTAKMDLLICVFFICFHEVAHTLNKQKKWLSKKQLELVSNESIFDTFENEEFKLKSAEADADISAINWTLNCYCTLKWSFSHLDIERIFSSIFLFMATFDLGRQSIREYQGISSGKSSHPIADLRSVIMMYGLFEGLSSAQNKISLEQMWKIFDSAILRSIRTLEAFAVMNCGYYILANSYMSASHKTQGFISQVTMMIIMQEELTKIENQYRELRDFDLKGQIFWIYRPYGFDAADSKFREMCEKEFYATFVNNERANFDAEAAFTEFLKERRSEMGDSGGHLLLLQHQFPEDIATNVDKYKVDDRYFHLALQVIFDAAGVTMHPSGDNTDG